MTKKAINKRLTLLSPEEIDSYFGVPQFTDIERSHYFSMSDEEHRLSQTLSSQTQWYFILQLAYFKAKKQFFIVDHNAAKVDVDFIVQTYQRQKPRKNVSEDSHRKIRKMLLGHCNISDDLSTARTELHQRAQELVMTTHNPKTIFISLYDYMAKSNYIIPQYSTFQKTISYALQQESTRLQKILDKLLPQYAVNALNQLLAVKDNFYEITSVKKDQKNFRHEEVKKVINYKQDYDRLYYAAKKIMPKLKITQNLVSYYASLVNHYPVAKLKILPRYKAYLYLLCYISQRLQKFNDNIMSSFNFYVDKYEKSSEKHAKQCIYEEKLNFMNDVKTKVPKILKLFIQESVDHSHIKKKGLKILPGKRLEKVIDYISGDSLDEWYFRWQHYEYKKSEIIKNLRPIFMSLDFQCSNSCNNLAEAIEFLKNQFNSKKPLTKVPINRFPTAFIPDNLAKYIYRVDDNNQITGVRYSQYEFCVYLRIRKHFKNNDVTIPDSINHKTIMDDLVPKHKRKSIIKELDNPLLSTPIRSTMPDNHKALDELYQRVNKQIENGDNKSVKIDQSGSKPRLILKYNSKEDLTNHRFFERLPKVGIIEILNFVHKKTRFLDQFTHIKPLYAKAKKDNQFILGVNLANATHYGIGKMASMSNLDYQLLHTAEKDFIRLDTLRPASDCISGATSKLTIFSHWAIQPNKIYAGVDGQKFQTRMDILMARNSAKYFPLKKGIVAYTLLADFIPLSVETISPNLHESYFLFDIIKNATANIQLDYVSGDSHSINPVNFLLMRYLPIEFAPHLVHINQKIANLYSIAHPNQYKGLIVAPHKHLKSDLILSEEDNISWLIASLLHGDVRQNIIVRKLSSLSKHHRTCKAMSEYNRVFESMYTLRYIDDPELRQYVRGSLNRIEAYHQLRRAIALANGGELRGGSELELIIWNESARLLANAIIYYNACLLSALLKKYQRLGDTATVELIKRISPIAWIHINLLGNFEFSLDSPAIDIESMVEAVDLF